MTTRSQPSRRRAPRRASIALAIALGVIGGILAPWSTTAAEATTAVRIFGPDRFATSATIAENVDPPTGSTVFIASGLSFADALAAGPVAAAEGGVLMLTDPGVLPASVRARIESIAPAEIVVVGGEAAIGIDVEAELAALAPVARIRGGDRVETAFLLLDRMRARIPVSTIWVASSMNFPDALSASAVAARTGAAVLLTSGMDGVFEPQLAQRPGIVQAHIAGGPAALPDSVLAHLHSVGIAADRVAGIDRYETSVLINRLHGPEPSYDRLILATGANFPDALAGGVLAAAWNAPLLLTPPACTTPVVRAEFDRLGMRTILALGGPTIISDVAAHLLDCTQPPPGAFTAWLDEVNAARIGSGVQPLQYHPGLAGVAQTWSEQMAAQHSMSHNPSYGSQIRALGCTHPLENVAWTTSEHTNPMVLWRNSPSHWAQILDPNVTHVGFGTALADDRARFSTQNFGRCL